MFGKNPVRKREHGKSGSQLILQGQPFHTIQGEGPLAGYPAVFVRLWGCHLRCTFCDTDFESDPRATDIQLISDYCLLCDLAVLTGGEPMRQNILPLVQLLLVQHHLVQIETSGSFWVAGLEEYKMDSALHIVVSPKTPTVDDRILNYATAWKYIISERHMQSVEDGLPMTDTQKGPVLAVLARPPKGTPRERVFVQPMDEQDAEQNRKNTERCIYLATKFGYRISLQQHKVLGVP